MATATNSYWYDSSNDEYIIPVINLGDMTNAPDANDPMGLASGWSSSFTLKGDITGEFPTSGLSSELEIVNALGRYGTFYASSESISSDNYFRVTEQSPGTYNLYANTDGVYNVANLTTNTTGYAQYFLAIAHIGNADYMGIYCYGTGLDMDEHPAWMFAYNEDPEQAWNVLAGLLAVDPAPGTKGFKPTKTKYVNTKKGIGGRGHGATHKGQTPAYSTDILTNPGAPDESTASVIGAGLIHPYKIDKTNLANLTACLYSTTLATALVNLAINPLDFIISLNIFPCSPDVGSSAYVTLGKWYCDMGGLGADVVGYPLSHQFKTISFGTLSVFENWGNFLDYSNSRIELYLPFIGFVDVDTAEVMDGTISVDYTIDFLTGMCVANVNCNKTVESPDGYAYPQSSQHAYQGNCAISVPLSQMQYGQMIGSLINAGVAGMRGGIAGAGMSMVGDFISGNLSPNGSTKGSISANAGFCSVLYPYIRITRPISAESDSFQEVMGYMSYIDSSLGECDDLCICKSIDLHSITGATDSEIERIRQMCLDGVHV